MVLTLAKALIFNALDGMPGKKATFKTYINQALTFAMGFVAVSVASGVVKTLAYLILCISATCQVNIRPK
jgi:hypothetical protein